MPCSVQPQVLVEPAGDRLYAVAGVPVVGHEDKPTACQPDGAGALIRFSLRYEMGDSMLRPIAVIAVGLLGVTSGQSEARPVQAEQSAKPVTNADVVSMTTATLSDDVIIGALQQAATADFDLSPRALIELKNAGVSDRVIQAMQARSKTAKPNEAEPNPAGRLGGAATESPLSEPCRIFITEEDPPSRSYVVVRKEVRVGKNFYGRHDDNLMRKLAKEADKTGADAVIQFREWRAPSKWSWAAAKAGGMAVKWTEEGKAGVSALKGQCWSPKDQTRE